MSRLLSAKTEIIPLLVPALILFVVPLASCGGDEGNQGSSGEAVTSYSAEANPRDGTVVEEVASSPAGSSDDSGGQGEPSERADQNPVGALPSRETGSSEENSVDEAGSSEHAGANPVAELPRRETPTPAFCVEDCPYFFDADGDGIGAVDSAGYDRGEEPPGWVPSYPDNCPEVYNPEGDQYGPGQSDSDGDGVGDACDPDTPGQYGDASYQYSDGIGP